MSVRSEKVARSRPGPGDEVSNARQNTREWETLLERNKLFFFPSEILEVVIAVVLNSELVKIRGAQRAVIST